MPKNLLGCLGMATNPGAPLVTGPLGMALLSFHDDPPDTRFADASVGYALIALWHGEKLLLVHERHRRCWELPGGGIEPGETPAEAAVRELREESGQVADGPGGLRFVGFARTALPDRPVLYGALFTGETTAPRPFTPNEEISALRWHPDQGAPPGDSPVQTVDLYLARRCRNGSTERVTPEEAR